MSDATQVALIAAVPSTIMAFATLIATWSNRAAINAQGRAQVEALKPIQEDIKAVKTTTDGMSTRLADATGRAGVAEGINLGAQQEQARMSTPQDVTVVNPKENPVPVQPLTEGKK